MVPNFSNDFKESGSESNTLIMPLIKCGHFNYWVYDCDIIKQAVWNGVGGSSRQLCSILSCQLSALRNLLAHD